MGYGALYVVDVLCERGAEPVKAVQGFSLLCVLQELGWGMLNLKRGEFCSGQRMESFGYGRVDKRGRVREEGDLGDASVRVDLWLLG